MIQDGWWRSKVNRLWTVQVVQLHKSHGMKESNHWLLHCSLVFGNVMIDRSIKTTTCMLPWLGNWIQQALQAILDPFFVMFVLQWLSVFKTRPKMIGETECEHRGKDNTKENDMYSVKPQPSFKLLSSQAIWFVFHFPVRGSELKVPQGWINVVLVSLRASPTSEFMTISGGHQLRDGDEWALSYYSDPVWILDAVQCCYSLRSNKLLIEKFASKVISVFWYAIRSHAYRECSFLMPPSHLLGIHSILAGHVRPYDRSTFKLHVHPYLIKYKEN